ncbi:hypothetical protein PINS_up004556 [Pythium insidiosum]|nr:hypothetical protein PINS_up004556 [Pythium insidiosum]
MKDVLAAKKLSPALQQSVQLTRIAIRLALRLEDTVPDDMLRDLLLGRPDEILRLTQSIAVDAVTDAAFDELCRVLEDAAYDPGAAARESEAGFFLDLDTAFLQLLRELETAHVQNKRLLPTTTFCVGVDGSRQSYIAFERTTRLRRQGLVRVVSIEEDIGAKSLQLPVISSEFIIDEYKAHAARLGVPPHRVILQSVNDGSASVSVATQLLDFCGHNACDLLVLGAIGKGGPAIEQLGHVPRDVLRFTPIPMLFRFAEEVFQDAQVQGILDVLPITNGSTIAECLHEYVSQHQAAVLILGLHGAQTPSPFTGNGLPSNEMNNIDVADTPAPELLENRIGRVARAMQFSPRCTLCLCP